LGFLFYIFNKSVDFLLWIVYNEINFIVS